MNDIEIILPQQRKSRPRQTEEVLGTSSNKAEPVFVKLPAGDAKGKFAGKETELIRDLPKRKKRKRESSKMAELRRKYATRRRMGPPRRWDEAKRRFWREWADRRSQRAQRWTVSRVPPTSRGLGRNSIAQLTFPVDFSMVFFYYHSSPRGSKKTIKKSIEILN